MASTRGTTSSASSSSAGANWSSWRNDWWSAGADWSSWRNPASQWDAPEAAASGSWGAADPEDQL